MQESNTHILTTISEIQLRLAIVNQTRHLLKTVSPKIDI